MSDAKDESRRRADHTVMFDNRLVAYIWQKPDGTLRHAKRRSEVISAIPYADIVVFSVEHAAQVTELVGKAEHLDALLFKLGIEGYSVEAGEIQPGAQLRRF
ncbi:MAG: hypothetical protein R3C68_00555 [Myxococcota bacterium]